MATYKDTLHIYWQHTHRRWSFLVWFYIFMPFAILAENFAIPYIGSQVIDKLTKHPHGPFNIFVPLLLAGLAVGIFTVVSWRFVSRRQWASNVNISNDLSQTVFDHLIAQSDRFHSDKFGGALVAAANRFSSSFSGLSDSIAYSLYGLLLSYIFTIIILWPKAPEFVIGLVLVSIGYAYIMYKLRMREIPYNEASAAAGSAQNAQLADTITNAMIVRSFGQEAYEHELYAKRLKTTRKRSLALMKITTRNEYVSASFTQLMNIAALTAGIVAVLSFHASIGIVLLLISYTGNIVGRLWDLQFTIKNVNNSLGNAQEMTELLKKKPEVRDLDEPLPLQIKQGAIHFSDVTFGYKDEKGKKLFNKLNLDIAPGEHIGLVGGSGSGKTTLTKLLLRFNDIDGGSITIDGQNIVHVSQSELRQHIAYVPQEPVLFHRTLLENIKYGKPNASYTSLERAAKHARVHDFAKKLPRGYETIVGERGTKLSGGQRQRIAIARAILKDSPIMIMDEATSALDSHSEKMIQEALKDLMEGRTSIVVAHRLSTIMEMDRIIVLENGKIVEQGNHHQLLESGGYYAKLWHHQSGGFLEEENKKPIDNYRSDS